MTTWVVLLRAVNVGGTSVVRGDDLRRAVPGAQVIGQSGNLLVSRPGVDAAQVGAEVQRALADALDLHSRAFVRTPAELAALADPDRWPADLPGSACHVWFLAAPPAAGAAQAAASVCAPTEALRFDGAHALLTAPDGIGRSKLAASLERRLGVPATARNLTTLRKLLTAAGRI